MLTQNLRSAVADVRDMLTVDLATVTNGDFLIDLDTQFLVAKMKPIIQGLSEALIDASDNNLISLEVGKSIESYAAKLPPDIAMLPGYIAQLRDLLIMHWEIIKGTDATYVHQPENFSAKLCSRIAAICALIYQGRVNFHEFQFLMPNILLFECINKNKPYNQFHKLNEFIFRDDNKTPIVIVDFFDELARAGNLATVQKKYTQEEIDRVINHSQEAYEYYMSLIVGKDITSAKAKFDQALQAGKPYVRSSYGKAGQKLFAKNLVCYTDDNVKTLYHYAIFIMKYIPHQHWLEYLQLVKSNESDQASIAEFIFKLTKDDGEAYASAKGLEAIKLLRHTVMKNPAEVADFMLKNITHKNEWPAFIKSTLLTVQDVKQVAAILLKGRDVNLQDVLTFVGNEISTPKALADFLQHYYQDCDKFKELVQKVLPKNEDQSELIKLILNQHKSSDVMTRYELAHYLMTVPNPRENWIFILSLVSEADLFRIMLKAKDNELNNYHLLKDKLGALIASFPDQPFVVNAIYQCALCVVLKDTYHRIRVKMPNKLGFVANWLGSDEYYSADAKLKASIALQDDIFRMLEEKHVDLNIEEHDGIKPHSKAFSNGFLLALKNALSATEMKLYQDRLSVVEHSARPT